MLEPWCNRFIAAHVKQLLALQYECVPCVHVCSIDPAIAYVNVHLSTTLALALPLVHTPICGEGTRDCSLVSVCVVLYDPLSCCSANGCLSFGSVLTHYSAIFPKCTFNSSSSGGGNNNDLHNECKAVNTLANVKPFDVCFL